MAITLECWEQYWTSPVYVCACTVIFLSKIFFCFVSPIPLFSVTHSLSLSLYIYIYMCVSCRLQGYPWPSLATSPYNSLPLAGLQGYIPYPHIAAVCMLELVVKLKKSWRQHLTKHQLYGHLPPITKTIQVRRTKHARLCWRSKDALISDILLWTPAYGQAKAGRPARTYILQPCEDTGCSPEDLPEAMNDREKLRERIKDIRDSGTTWWWWWWWCPPLHYFTTFVFHAINRLVSSTTLPSFVILLRLIYFRFSIIDSYSGVLCVYHRQDMAMCETYIECP